MTGGEKWEVINETRRLGRGEWGMVRWRLGWKAGREAPGVGEWKVESRMWRAEGCEGGGE